MKKNINMHGVKNRVLNGPHPHPHPHHPQHHMHHHHSHHLWGASITIKYAEGIESIKSVFGETADTVIQVIEKAPPEMKVILALALGLQVDIGQYWDGAEDYEPVTFSPFLDEDIITALSAKLSVDGNKVIPIFDGAPPEVVTLAVAICHLLNPNKPSQMITIE